MKKTQILSTNLSEPTVISSETFLTQSMILVYRVLINSKTHPVFPDCLIMFWSEHPESHSIC